MNLVKTPGVAETLDWAAALAALNASELNQEVIVETAGCFLKDEADLRKFLATKLTAYKMPRRIEFRSDLPKTNVGKILRRALRDETIVRTQSAAGQAATHVYSDKEQQPHANE